MRFYDEVRLEIDLESREFLPQENEDDVIKEDEEEEDDDEEEEEGTLSPGRSSSSSPMTVESNSGRKRKVSCNSQDAQDINERRKRRGNGKPVYIASHLPQGALCLVCEAIATGNHYNSVTCEGCKGFFRRSVQSGNWRLYNCSKTGNCQVGKKDRGSCKKCRYEKCVAKGMDKSRVLDENARKKLKKLKEDNREKRQERKTLETTQKTTSGSPEKLERTQQRSKNRRSGSVSLSEDSRSFDESSRSSGPPSEHLVIVEELSRTFSRIGLDAKPNESSLTKCVSSPDWSNIFYPSILIAAKLGSIFCRQIPGFDQISDAPRLISRGFWTWFLMRMMTTYDSTKDTIILDIGQTFSRQQAKSFGEFIPDKLFDLARRLSFKMVLTTEIIATMSALTIINADIEDIGSPSAVMLLEDRLLAGIYDHLVELGEDVENQYNRFIDILTDLRRLGKDYCSRIAAARLVSLSNGIESIVSSLPGVA